MIDENRKALSNEWVAFPGGELEGRRPKAVCTGCRERLALETPGGGRQRRSDSGAGDVLCFQCYRADLARERAVKAAGELDTASEARFQTALPFEPVNVPRLEMLKVDRAQSRETALGADGYADRRRRAQLDARRSLQAIFNGVRTRRLKATAGERQIADAVHAAELQLPEAWLPFVVAR